MDKPSGREGRWQDPNWQDSPRMSAVWVLLLPQRRQARSLLRGDRPSDRWRTLIFIVFATIFGLGTWWVSSWLFGKFAQVEVLANLLIVRTLTIALFFFSGLLVFSSLITAFTTFYLAADLEGLRALPIEPRTLFASRLTTTWLYTSWGMLFFLMPIFSGAGPALNAPVLFYICAFFGLLAVTGICTTLGTLLSLFVTRFMPAQRGRDLLILIAILAFVMGYIAFRLAEPEQYLEPDGFSDLVSLIAELNASANEQNPIQWVVQACLSTIDGHRQQTLLVMLRLYAVTLSAIYLAVLIGGRLYPSAYSRAHYRPNVQPRKSDVGHHVWRQSSSPIHALIKRDRQIFVRSPSQWTQLILVMALVVVYLLNFQYFEVLRESGTLGLVGLFGINYLLSGLIVATLSVRFLFPSVSLEGKAFWCIESSPVQPLDFLTAKRRFGSGMIIATGVGLVVAAGWITQLGPSMIVLSFFSMALYGVLVTQSATDLGAVEPNFNLDNPARIASSLTAVIFMLGALLYLAVSMLLLLPLAWWGLRVNLSNLFVTNWTVVLVGVSSVILAVTFWALRRLCRRLGLAGLERLRGG